VLFEEHVLRIPQSPIMNYHHKLWLCNKPCYEQLQPNIRRQELVNGSISCLKSKPDLFTSDLPYLSEDKQGAY